MSEEFQALQLLEHVALKRDLPEHGLKKGDVATLVDYVPHPEGEEQGCVLEVFNALGESITIVAVRESEVRGLDAGEVLSVRSRHGKMSIPTHDEILALLDRLKSLTADDLESQ